MIFAQEKLVDQGQGKWTVTIDGEQWTEFLKKAKNRLKANLVVPGFRKGKAPESETAKCLTPIKLYNEAFKIVIKPAFDFALTQENRIQNDNSPTPVIVKVSEKEIVIDFVFDLVLEVKIGEYKNISTIKKSTVEVSQEDVDNVIDMYRSRFAMQKEKEANDQIQKGDIVTFDFKGYVDDQAFEGGEAKDFVLEIGSNQFVPGFEDSMIGLKVGENQEINVKFPEEYIPSLAGKDAKFVLNIKNIKEKILPAKDDELVKDLNLPDITTYVQLEEKVKKDVLEQKTKNNKSEFVENIIDEIIKTSEFQIPKTIVERQLKDVKKEFEDQLTQQKITLEKYKGITKILQEEIDEELKNDAIHRIKSFLVVSEIKNKENIKASEEAINTKFEEFANLYGIEVEKIKSLIDNQAIKHQVESELLETFIFENNGN
ncbi:trigger factor [Mycoplasma capricolum subsp. capripneumoniae]|uniref:trigger factor n=1 Tax=Mycoplasma capricolum TaxID=2095 RepID=UPI0003063443|nr:trigger factor [Mycoplasma capricolum]AOQ22213.1 trigger factor [Mycoplasma capricolum subsp. capripneumoniae M1601]KEY84621.1 Trigger factor [Mycoplasma capricolum subsp. capripneumoniae 99108]QDL19679.1 trigger factor [Mycoplasma capricolum subsp. capripneumoniae]QDL20364.1 trigger factor [Mycoplasma capricolum subsp. capripneumoniae]QDL21051.1 trigger factor [Mycoplasma capricolum subsp. capripneumoniae]